MAFAATCVACSTDPVVWGAEGAEVRSLTNQFIAEVRTSEEPGRVCADADLELGSSSAWEGITAGEPEEYTGDEWKEYANLSPSWLINLSPSNSGEKTGVKEVPAYLFYRGSGDELCVAGIAWGEQTT